MDQANEVSDSEMVGMSDLKLKGRFTNYDDYLDQKAAQEEFDK